MAHFPVSPVDSSMKFPWNVWSWPADNCSSDSLIDVMIVVFVTLGKVEKVLQFFIPIVAGVIIFDKHI
jgi:hypothetical protein